MSESVQEVIFCDPGYCTVVLFFLGCSALHYCTFVLSVTDTTVAARIGYGPFGTAWYDFGVFS